MQVIYDFEYLLLLQQSYPPNLYATQSTIRCNKKLSISLLVKNGKKVWTKVCGFVSQTRLKTSYKILITPHLPSHNPRQECSNSKDNFYELIRVQESKINKLKIKKIWMIQNAYRHTHTHTHLSMKKRIKWSITILTDLIQSLNKLFLSN